MDVLFHENKASMDALFHENKASIDPLFHENKAFMDALFRGKTIKEMKILNRLFKDREFTNAEDLFDIDHDINQSF